jgi:hypothetical protein
LKLIFAGYTGSKNPVQNRLKILFVELDFSKLIFQKSSTDQQGNVCLHLIFFLFGRDVGSAVGRPLPQIFADQFNQREQIMPTNYYKPPFMIFRSSNIPVWKIRKIGQKKTKVSISTLI